MKTSFCLAAFLFLASTPLAAGDLLYELSGKVVPTKEEFDRASASVSLHGTTFPFTKRMRLYPSGEFRFKNLRPGSYTLIVAVPRAAPIRRTIEIGPSQADKDRKIVTVVEFERKPFFRQITNTVPATQLVVPENARSEYRKGVEALSKQETDRAVQFFKKALEIAPNYVGARTQLGNIAYQEEDYETAEAHYRAILDEVPTSFGALVNLGGVLLAQARYEESLEINHRAEKLRPDEPMVQTQLGFCYYHLLDSEDALLHLQKAKTLEPGHFAFPQLLLAQIYQERHDVPAAIRELEEFLSLHPDSKRAAEARADLDRLKKQDR